MKELINAVEHLKMKSPRKVNKIKATKRLNMRQNI